MVSAQNVSQVDVDALERALQAKCEQTDAATDLQGPKVAVRACLDQYVNVTQVQQELHLASQSGSMDEVFGKYCRQFPQVFGCLENATISLRRCLSPVEAGRLDSGLVLLQDMQEFMCVKDGDRLACKQTCRTPRVGFALWAQCLLQRAGSSASPSSRRRCRPAPTPPACPRTPTTRRWPF